MIFIPCLYGNGIRFAASILFWRVQIIQHLKIGESMLMDRQAYAFVF